MPDATPSTQHAAPGGGTQPDGRPLAIRLRAVAKTFGKGESAVRALRGVDLDVPAGALTMLVGPSGCGKTTLISILAGLLARDAGELAQGLLAEGITAMKIWPFDAFASTLSGPARLREPATLNL